MKVAYVTPSTFSTVNAGALRNFGIAVSLTLRGHAVVIITPDASQSAIDAGWFDLVGGRQIAITAGGTSADGVLGFGRIRRYLVGPTAMLSARLDELAPDRVLAYNPGPFAFRRIRSASAARGVPMLLDVSEWLGPRDLPGGRFGPFAATYAWHMRRLPGYGLASIAISEPLAGHLNRRGSRTLVVPPLFELDEDPHHSVDAGARGVRLLVISGGELRSASKDALPVERIIAAVELAGDDRPEIRLDVVGPIAPAFRAEIARRLAGTPVEFHGRRSWEQTRELTKLADFLVVLRDPGDRRMNVGFPSKVAESLLLGTPVIANSFSDLRRYLRDGDNALLLASTEPTEMLRTLQRATPFADRERIAAEAARIFAPAAHARALEELLEAAE